MKSTLIQLLFLTLFIQSWNSLPAQILQRISGKLNLKQCVETALENNLQIRQSAYQSEVNKNGYEQSKANRLPQISANISHGINKGRSIDPFTNGYVNQQINFANYSLNAGIVLWNGSAIQQNIKQNEWNYQASMMELQQLKDNVTITTILAYLQVLNNYELLLISKKQVEVTITQVSRLDNLHKSGAIVPSLYYDLKGQLSSDELTVLTVKNALESAKINLAQLMNVPYDTHVALETISESLIPVIYENGPDSIYQQANQQLALVKAANYRKMSARSAIKSIKGQLLPTISLNGGWGTNYSSIASRQEFISTVDQVTNSYVNTITGKLPVVSPQNNYQNQKISYGDQWKNNYNNSVSLGIQIPILNGMQTKTKLRQAVIQEKRADFELSTVKTQLRQQIDQAYLNMNTAFERYQTLLKQKEDYQSSFLIAETRFTAGLTTSVEYLASKNNLDKTNSAFASAKYDFFLRCKVLDFYQGKRLW